MLFRSERTVGASVSLSGTVVPYKEVTLSAQMPGRVVTISGKEGDHFKQGSTLVELDDISLKAKLRAAEASLRNSEASMRNAGVQYSRELISPQRNSTQGGMGMPTLFDNMMTKPMAGMMGHNKPGLERGANLTNLQTNVEQARGAREQALSQIETINAMMRNTLSKAPFDGVIVKKFIEVGDTKQPGQPLLKFADINKLQIRVDVPARLMRGIREGDVVSAKLDINNVIIEARVAQIFPMADKQRHTVTVKFDIPKASPAAPGMYAEVSIPDVTTQARTIPLIPKAAVKWRSSLPGVYVINAQNKPELRLLRLGEEIGDKITVLSGLRAGERILSKPAGNISSGWSK